MFCIICDIIWPGSQLAVIGCCGSFHYSAWVMHFTYTGFSYLFIF